MLDNLITRKALQELAGTIIFRRGEEYFVNEAVSRNLLIALAGKLEPTRPTDAITLYRRVVPPIVRETNNSSYAEAIKLIRKMGNLMRSLDQSREFADYLAELHAQFKAKRNFIKLLDGVAQAHVTGSKR